MAMKRIDPKIPFFKGVKWMKLKDIRQWLGLALEATPVLREQVDQEKDPVINAAEEEE